MVLKNEVYKTQSGKLLQVSAVRESGLHHFKEVDELGIRVNDKRNSFGHVVHRTDLVYSEETIKSFKKVKQ